MRPKTLPSTSPPAFHALNLRSNHRCAIHDDLVKRGFPGCDAFDCYGAGQRMTRAFEGRRGDRRERDEAFRILRGVHEMLWLLTEAVKLCPSSHFDLGRELALAVHVFDAIAGSPVPALFEIDLGPPCDAARALLLRVGDALGGRRGANRSLPLVR